MELDPLSIMALPQSCTPRNHGIKQLEADFLQEFFYS